MKIAFIIAALVLTGCDAYKQTLPDQALRRQIFTDCLKNLPAGPDQTRYNDWAEVVNECGSQAYYQSLKL